MIIILLGAVFLVGASVALVARAVAMPRVRAAETIGQIDSYGYAGQGAKAAAGAGLRGPLDELAGLVGGLLASRFGGPHEAELRNELMSAGLYSTSPRKFLGYQALAAITLPRHLGVARKRLGLPKHLRARRHPGRRPARLDGADDGRAQPGSAAPRDRSTTTCPS